MRRPKGTGCIYRQPNSKIWWLKYSRHGKPQRESSGFTDEKKAAKLLKVRLAQIATGTFAGLEVERVKVDELAEDFLRDYRINGRKSTSDVEARWNLHLKPFFGGMRVIDVTSDQVNQYVDQRQQERAANATVNRELAALKRAFSLGFKATPAKVLRMPAFPHLEENNVREGFLEDDQYRKLIAGAELWFRALVECGRTYGWRHQELLSMQVSQIDLTQRIIRLEPGSTKNKDGREAAMTNAVFHLLAACVEGKQVDDRVFTRLNGEPVRDFRDAWAKACCAADIGRMLCATCGAVVRDQQCPECDRRLRMNQQTYRGLLFHDLRRTGARNLRRAGIPETVVMKIGGWKTTSVFHRYAIVDRRDITTAMLQLEAHERKLEREAAEQSEAQAQARIGHSLVIVDPLELPEVLPGKIQ